MEVADKAATQGRRAPRYSKQCESRNPDSPYLFGRISDAEFVESDFRIPQDFSGQLANPSVDATSADAWANGRRARRRPTCEQMCKRTGLRRRAGAAEFWTPFMARTLYETADGNVGRPSAAKSRNPPLCP